jgi:hypothetical protein
MLAEKVLNTRFCVEEVKDGEENYIIKRVEPLSASLEL